MCRVLHIVNSDNDNDKVEDEEHPIQQHKPSHCSSSRQATGSDLDDSDEDEDAQAQDLDEDEDEDDGLHHLHASQVGATLQQEVKYFETC